MVMSGKDLQTFITSYRPEDAEKLTMRMKNGHSNSKYKPAEYKRLQAIVDAKRLESDLIGQKVQKTRCAAKATKESSLLRQHRQVWIRECQMLQKAEKEAEDDITDFLERLEPNSVTDSAIFSLQEYELSLERELETFRTATVEPVYQLRDDLHFRLVKMQNQQLSECPSDWEQVIQQCYLQWYNRKCDFMAPFQVPYQPPIQFVKDQQEDVIAKLHEEYLDVDEEIMSLDLEKYLASTSDILVSAEKIPGEVLDADCPYPELKVSLIQAFQYLSEMYQRRLQNVQEQLQKADRFCGWYPDDHKLFKFIVSMYTQDIPNHRALCMDMLLRLFPGRTRLELMEHGRLLDLQRFSQTQQRALNQQWKRDLEELLARALATLQEAKHAHQEELELYRDRQHQQDICLHLREKLHKWQAQQEEVAKLEGAIAARQQEEEELRIKQEKEKEVAMRSKQKEKVRQFYLKKQKRREALEHRDQERLATLRSLMEEQARRDRQRVQFRADVLQQRREERDMRELERQTEEQERRNRLEALRKQVAVVAEADSERMMGDTKSWRSRHLNDKEFELQRPLYSINTYTDTQIVSDPRLRAEQALREAGLHQSQYAKEVLSEIKALKPPRRDTISILEF